MRGLFRNFAVMMTKAELFERLNQTEWTDFEIKEALTNYLRTYGKALAHFPIRMEDGLFLA